MTPQHPAAPEGESEVSGLTEAERASLRRDIRNRYYLRGIATNETGLMASVEAACDVFDTYVAERVRVVKGERDAAREKAEWWERTCTYWNEQATEAQRFRDLNLANADRERREVGERIAQAIEADVDRMRSTGGGIYTADFAAGAQSTARIARDEAAR